MNAKLNFAPPSSTVTVATAALATVIAMGILWAVVTLFQSRGAPMERLAAAELPAPSMPTNRSVRPA